MMAERSVCSACKLCGGIRPSMVFGLWGECSFGCAITCAPRRREAFAARRASRRCAASSSRFRGHEHIVGHVPLDGRADVSHDAKLELGLRFRHAPALDEPWINALAKANLTRDARQHFGFCAHAHEISMKTPHTFGLPECICS